MLRLCQNVGGDKGLWKLSAVQVMVIYAITFYCQWLFLGAALFFFPISVFFSLLFLLTFFSSPHWDQSRAFCVQF